MITPIEIEKELITLIENYSFEEIQFSNRNKVFKTKALELLDSENESDIIFYLKNELFKSAIIKKYFDDKIEISFNDFINQQITRIKDDLIFLDKRFIELNDKVGKNTIKLKDLNENNIWGNGKYELEEENKIFNEILNEIISVKKFHLNQLEISIQFLKENIDLSSYDLITSKKSLETISKILLIKEIKFPLNFKTIEIEKAKFNIVNQVEPYYLDKKFKDFSKDFKGSIKTNPNIIPDNWKKEIHLILKNLKSRFDGYYSDDNFAINNSSFNISPFDYSFFIALRNNLSQNEFITEDKVVFLPLSGGIMAQIIFKKYSLTENRMLLYVNGDIDYRDAISNKKSSELYPVESYSNGSVNILLPRGYTFLLENLFCQISFHAAPVLFENNTSKIFNNLSSDSEKYDDDNRDY